jgi:hypothetical protein
VKELRLGRSLNPEDVPVLDDRDLVSDGSPPWNEMTRFPGELRCSRPRVSEDRESPAVSLDAYRTLASESRHVGEGPFLTLPGRSHEGAITFGRLRSAAWDIQRLAEEQGALRTHFLGDLQTNLNDFHPR